MTNSRAAAKYGVSERGGARERGGWRGRWRELLWGTRLGVNHVYGFGSADVDRQASVVPARSKLQDQVLTNMKRLHKGGVSLFGEDHKHAMQRDDVLTPLVIKREAALTDLEHRMVAKRDIFAGSFYLLFYVLFFWVIVGQTQTRDRYELERAMTSYVQQATFDADGSVLEDIQNLEDVWSWLENAFVPAVFPEETWYNGERKTGAETGFLMEYNRLVGGFQLVLQKVVPDHEDCHVSPRFGQWAGHCFNRYHDSVRQEMAYGPSHDPYKYTFWEAYSDDQAGYHVRFPLDRKFALRQLKELKSDQFLDRESRELVIDFTVYNENKHLFCSVTVHIVLLDSGLIETYFKLASVQVEHYPVGSGGRMLAEILIVLYVTIQLADELREALEIGLIPYFASPWNWIDVLRIAFFISAIAKSVRAPLA